MTDAKQIYNPDYPLLVVSTVRFLDLLHLDDTLRNPTFQSIKESIKHANYDPTMYTAAIAYEIVQLSTTVSRDQIPGRLRDLGYNANSEELAVAMQLAKNYQIAGKDDQILQTMIDGDFLQACKLFDGLLQKTKGKKPNEIEALLKSFSAEKSDSNARSLAAEAFRTISLFSQSGHLNALTLPTTRIDSSLQARALFLAGLHAQDYLPGIVKTSVTSLAPSASSPSATGSNIEELKRLSDQASQLLQRLRRRAGLTGASTPTSSPIPRSSGLSSLSSISEENDEAIRAVIKDSIESAKTEEEKRKKSGETKSSHLETEEKMAAVRAAEQKLFNQAMQHLITLKRQIDLNKSSTATLSENMTASIIGNFAASIKGDHAKNIAYLAIACIQNEDRIVDGFTALLNGAGRGSSLEQSRDFRLAAQLVERYFQQQNAREQLVILHSIIDEDRRKRTAVSDDKAKFDELARSLGPTAARGAFLHLYHHEYREPDTKSSDLKSRGSTPPPVETKTESSAIEEKVTDYKVDLEEVQKMKNRYDTDIYLLFEHQSNHITSHDLENYRNFVALLHRSMYGHSGDIYDRADHPHNQNEAVFRAAIEEIRKELLARKQVEEKQQREEEQKKKQSSAAQETKEKQAKEKAKSESKVVASQSDVLVLARQHLTALGKEFAAADDIIKPIIIDSFEESIKKDPARKIAFMAFQILQESTRDAIQKKLTALENQAVTNPEEQRQRTLASQLVKETLSSQEEAKKKQTSQQKGSDSKTTFAISDTADYARQAREFVELLERNARRDSTTPISNAKISEQVDLTNAFLVSVGADTKAGLRELIAALPSTSSPNYREKLQECLTAYIRLRYIAEPPSGTKFLGTLPSKDTVLKAMIKDAEYGGGALHAKLIAVSGLLGGSSSQQRNTNILDAALAEAIPQVEELRGEKVATGPS